MIPFPLRGKTIQLFSLCEKNEKIILIAMNSETNNNTMEKSTICECSDYAKEIRKELNIMHTFPREEQFEKMKYIIDMGYRYIISAKKCCNNVDKFINTVINKICENYKKYPIKLQKTFDIYMKLFNDREPENKCFCLISECNEFTYMDVNIWMCKSHSKKNLHQQIHDVYKNYCISDNCERFTITDPKTKWVCKKHDPINPLKKELNKYNCSDVTNIIIEYYNKYDENDYRDFIRHYDVHYCSNDGCGGHNNNSSSNELKLAYYADLGNVIMYEHELNININYYQKQEIENTMLHMIDCNFINMAKYFLEHKHMVSLDLSYMVSKIDTWYRYSEDLFEEDLFKYLVLKNLQQKYPKYNIELKMSKKTDDSNNNNEEQNISSEM